VNCDVTPRKRPVLSLIDRLLWRSTHLREVPTTQALDRTPSLTVASAAVFWNSVADPRMRESTDQLVAVVRALDGTWHRPFTTLELAALQSLLEPEEFSGARWPVRQRMA
jgi:hypothetical protein